MEEIKRYSQRSLPLKESIEVGVIYACASFEAMERGLIEACPWTTVKEGKIYKEVQDLSVYKGGLVYPKEDYIPVKIKVAECNKENKNKSVLVKNDEVFVCQK